MAVAASQPVGPMSAAEYLATPEDRPRHAELINGSVVVNEPTLPYQRVDLPAGFGDLGIYADNGSTQYYVNGDVLTVHQDGELILEEDVLSVE